MRLSQPVDDAGRSQGPRADELAAENAELRRRLADAERRAEAGILRVNRLYEVLRSVDHAIVHLSDREELFEAFCRAAVEPGEFRLAAVGLVERESGAVRMVASRGETAYLDEISISSHPVPEGMGPAGVAIREGRLAFCNDFANAEATFPWLEAALSHGLRSGASVPIRENGEVVGCLTLWAGEVDAFDSRDLDLLEQMGADISFSLDNLRLEARIHEAQLKAEMAEERERAAEALRESEARFRSLFENTPDAVFLTIPDGRILAANPAACAMFGRSEDELCRLGREPLIDHSDPRFAAALDMRSRTGRSSKLELRFLRKNGESFPAEVDSVILPGNPPSSFVILRDISGRKQAEEALRLSEEKFSRAFAESPAALALSTLEEGVLVDVNDTWLALHGFKREEVLGKSARRMGLWADGEQMLRFVAELKTHGSVRGWEAQFVKKDKTPFVAQLSAQVLSVGDDRVILLTIVDITERKWAERRLTEMNEELERRVAMRTGELEANMEMLKAETAERIRVVEALRKNEQLLIQQNRLAALGEMIGNIAHQWRQPLNSLGLLIQQPSLCFARGALTKDILDETTAKSMTLVRHMSRTIDDFRNYFKPEKEKVSFRVLDELEKTLSLIEGSFQGQKIDMELMAEADPEVLGYPNEFAQVLVNVLINARDAFQERQVARPKILIKVGCVGERAVVAIADNAGGIPDEIIGKVFDPYFTTKGPAVGTGVGLFMSKTIIEKNMGGRLTVRNIEGGAEFMIEI
ncbi:hypothetical protein GMSM_01790 [Geomonas sp. Red276]